MLIEVPDLVGRSTDYAAGVLTALGLQAVITEVEAPGGAPGIVVEQLPLPGTATTEQSVVILRTPLPIGAIAFWVHRDSGAEILLMNEDGTDVRQLTDHDGNDWSPVWSPSGDRIAFSSDRDGDDEVFVMNTDGTGVRQLTNNDYDDDRYPIWSPSGDRIAFSSDRWGEMELFVMNTDGTDVVSLGHRGFVSSWGRGSGSVELEVPATTAPATTEA